MSSSQASREVRAFCRCRASELRRVFSARVFGSSAAVAWEYSRIFPSLPARTLISRLVFAIFVTSCNST